MSGPSFASETDNSVKQDNNNVANDYMPTVLILGGTGVGKSSLINAILDLRTPSIATTSSSASGVHFDRSSPQWGKEVGAAVSSGGARSTKSYTTYGPTGQYRIRLIDSRGLEREGHTAGVNSVYDYIRQGNIGGLGVERVDIVCVVTGTRWERGDISLIKGLRERQVIVVVIIAKADEFATSNPEELASQCTESKDSHLCGINRMTRAIKNDFADIPVFVTADVDNSLSAWEHEQDGKYRQQKGRKRAPLHCANGHGREWFVESRVQGTWECTWCDSDGATNENAKCCNESGMLGTEAFGVKVLRRAIEQSRDGLARRGILHDQIGIVTRARAEVSHRVEEVFWNAVKFSDEFSKTMCVQARKMAFFVAEQYVATRVMTRVISTGLIDQECTALSHRSRGPMGIFRSLSLNTGFDTRDSSAENGAKGREAKENMQPSGNGHWVWSFMTRNVSAAVMGMSVQVVMMGCAFALENILFVDATGPGVDINERFATILSKFCKESAVDNMSEVRARFRRERNRIDATVSESFEQVTSDIVADISKHSWGGRGYE